jgi:hypothetical protein
MPTLSITWVGTVNQRGQNVALFNPFFDALALVMSLEASADLLALPNPYWSASFQIIHPHTNAVVVDEVRSGPFQWGPAFWISLGNNWAPDYTTIQKWGLHWAGPGTQALWGFRAIIRGYNWTAQEVQTVEAVDVAEIRWFRAMEIFEI